jgi:SAM-dependent methyltransferase/uncharacterized protein YbaR (Trm112 family)
MKLTLLEHIVCPADHLPLHCTAASRTDSDIITGVLRCDAGHAYPITNGVPRLLQTQNLSGDAEQTQTSFSGKWQHIPNFGIEPHSRRVYVDWYLQRFGFGDLDGLRCFLKDKKRVLDAGAGVGRDALLYGENSMADVFAIDISTSVDLVYRHVGYLPHVHVLQADLTALPFRERFFDYIASDQVLHHTRDTASSFRTLWRYLMPGGQIAVYVYRKKGPVREFCDDFLRAHYTDASEEECYAFSSAMTLLGKALSDLAVEVDVPKDIPILDIKAGKQDLQRFVYWNVLKCYWNANLDFETNVMTNYDWYHPRFAHRHTPEEVHAWCSDLGLEIIHFDVVESGISVRAQKGRELCLQSR